MFWILPSSEENVLSILLIFFFQMEVSDLIMYGRQFVCVILKDGTTIWEIEFRCFFLKCLMISLLRNNYFGEECILLLWPVRNVGPFNRLFLRTV